MALRSVLLATVGAAVLVSSPAPAHAFAWTWWVGAGGGARHLSSGEGDVIFEPRVGGSVVLASKLDFSSFHSLLVGPWLQAATQLDGVLGEGGSS